MTEKSASCVVVTWFAMEQPGFLDFSYRIRALARNFRVTVLARAPITQEELMVPGVEYLVQPTTDSSKRSLVTYILRVTTLLRQRRPRLVVYLSSVTAAAVLLTPRQRSAVYWNEHPSHCFLEWPFRTHPVKALTNILLRRATYEGAIRAGLTMPIGEAHMDDLIAHGASSKRLKLLHMGVDERFIKRSPCPPVDDATPLRLIYTGSVAKERGRDIMLEGLALANQGEVRAKLTLIGALPDQIAYCRRRSEELGIGQHLNVLPRVAGTEIPSLLAKADLGICIWEDRTYWRFNPPTKLFEYLVAGLPVLASDIRTHTRYVTDGVNGQIFQYSAKSFAEALVQLWARRSDLTRLKQNAAKSGEQYLWARIEPEFLGAVRDIVGDSQFH